MAPFRPQMGLSLQSRSKEEETPWTLLIFAVDGLPKKERVHLLTCFIDASRGASGYRFRPDFFFKLRLRFLLELCIL